MAEPITTINELPPPCVQTWQPIETAPKDATSILVAGGIFKRPVIVEWSCVYRAFLTGHYDSYGTPLQYGSGYFTHWMPLPDPPMA